MRRPGAIPRFAFTGGWEKRHPLALVVGINPNTATDTEDNAMTGFLTRLMRGLEEKYKCGGYIVVNCCDIRWREPKELINFDTPCSPTNMSVIRDKLAISDFVVASWGTSDYGRVVAANRQEVEATVRASGKPVICFSPKGLPIYCGQTNANSVDGRWSKTPVLLGRVAHNG